VRGIRSPFGEGSRRIARDESSCFSGKGSHRFLDDRPSGSCEPRRFAAVPLTRAPARCILSVSLAHPTEGASASRPASSGHGPGGLAQLVERYNGIVEVRGSTPLSSTISPRVESPEIAATSVESGDSASERLGVLLGVLDRESPDLALVVRSWQRLSDPLRAAVLAIVRTPAQRRAERR
jgi:hypothetical protein